VPLASQTWPDVAVIGGESPGGLRRKTTTLAGRAKALTEFARAARPDVALSHGSYAQAVAARLARVPVVTMMDYEHQPANHLSFRLAKVVVVPAGFPSDALRRFGVRNGRALRYDGYKEELYLAGFTPDTAVLERLGLTDGEVVVAMRPPPDGALYHRGTPSRFDDVLDRVLRDPHVRVVLLPRFAWQGDRVLVPATPVDGRSLAACADLVIGAGGTMNREAALLGTPTYTVFAGRLAALDRRLLDERRLFDLREPGTWPRLDKRTHEPAGLPRERREAIMEVVSTALATAAR
jgi:predicted glycosyltransferase